MLAVDHLPDGKFFLHRQFPSALKTAASDFAKGIVFWEIMQEKTAGTPVGLVFFPGIGCTTANIVAVKEKAGSRIFGKFRHVISPFPFVSGTMLCTQDRIVVTMGQDGWFFIVIMFHNGDLNLWPLIICIICINIWFQPELMINCLSKTVTREDGTKVKTYYHKVLEAKLVLAEKVVISLDTEFIENEKEDVASRIVK